MILDSSSSLYVVLNLRVSQTGPLTRLQNLQSPLDFLMMRKMHVTRDSFRSLRQWSAKSRHSCNNIQLLRKGLPFCLPVTLQEVLWLQCCTATCYRSPFSQN